MSNYDFKQLTSAVSHSDINKYRKDGYKLSEKIAPAYHFVPIISFVFGVMGYLPARLIEDVTENNFYFLLIIIIFALVGFFEGWYLCVTVPKRTWIRLVRLARFTHANDLEYDPEATGSTNDGLLFSQPNTFEVFDTIYKKSKSGREFEFGNVSVTKANVITPIKAYNWGFIHLELNQSVPHIVLDGKSNDHLLTKTNLSENINKREVVDVEGDLQGYFTVYAFDADDQAARDTLNPRLRELFMARLSQYDIEFIGTSLYIYKNKWFDLDQQQTLESIFEIVSDLTLAMDHPLHAASSKTTKPRE